MAADGSSQCPEQPGQSKKLEPVLRLELREMNGKSTFDGCVFIESAPASAVQVNSDIGLYPLSRLHPGK